MKEQQANQPASAVLGLHIKAPPPAAHNLHFLHTTKNRSKMAFVILRENGANDLWKTTGDMAVLALYECPMTTLIVQQVLLCQDRKSTRLNSSHVAISYAVFCLKKKTATGSLTTA